MAGVATTRFIHVTRAAEKGASKDNIQIFYLHTRLTANRVLKDLLKKGNITDWSYPNVVGLNGTRNASNGGGNGLILLMYLWIPHKL